MTTPPPYPRIPQLVAGEGNRDDLVLSPTEARALLSGELVVEEKLDGANVAVWSDGGGLLRCATRGGPEALDRAGQLGPLRAWTAANDLRLRTALSSWPVAYCEWLLLTHSTQYDLLPSYLVVLDLWDPDRGFAPVDERNDVGERSDLAVPPRRWRGMGTTVGDLEGMIGEAAWATGPAEGVVVRRAGGGEPRLAKVLRPGFQRIGDDAWETGRPRNRLAGGVASWH